MNEKSQYTELSDREIQQEIIRLLSLEGFPQPILLFGLMSRPQLELALTTAQEVYEYKQKSAGQTSES